MNENDEQSFIMKSLDFIYDKAINGLPGMPSAQKIAEDYLKRDDNKTTKEKAHSLINYQILKTSISGFTTGLGGIITLPIAVPADVSIVLYYMFK
jgi:hypothetical protein